MSAPRIVIWKHDCVAHGQGEDEPCDPPCDDPWQVDLPIGVKHPDGIGTFATHAEAVECVFGKLGAT